MTDCDISVFLICFLLVLIAIYVLAVYVADLVSAIKTLRKELAALKKHLAVQEPETPAK